MKTQYVICNQFGTIRIEPAVYAGTLDYVQTYVDAEAAGRAAETLNDEITYAMKDGKPVTAPPWTVWEMKPHGTP